MTNHRRVARGVLVALLVTASTQAAATQMEKRTHALYDVSAFETSKPAVGERAPNLVLRDLDGKPVALSDYRGETLVVIKAGYT